MVVLLTRGEGEEAEDDSGPEETGEGGFAVLRGRREVLRGRRGLALRGWGGGLGEGEVDVGVEAEGGVIVGGAELADGVDER